MALRYIPAAIASAFTCVVAVHLLAVQAQQTSPMVQSTGGMSFKKVNRDRMALRSSSQSGSRASGLAATSSGGIRVGGSSSVVDVVLNALDESCDSCELPIAGDSSVFGNAFDIQSSPNNNSQFQLDSARSKFRGNLTSDFISELLEFNEILRITELPNPEEPLRPIKKVKTNENFTQLSGLAAAQDSNGADLNYGAHVIFAQSDQSSRPRVSISKLIPFKPASGRSVLVEGGEQRKVSLQFLGVGSPSSASKNLITSNFIIPEP